MTPKEFYSRFEHAVAARTLSHAYVLFGEGSNEDRFSCAFSLAYFLERGSFTVPRGSYAPLSECHVISGTDQAISIDDVRYAQDFLYRAPVFSSRRVVIIRDASFLTPESQHALLKILEEPPLTSLMLFVLSREELLLPTLLSRLQRIHITLSSDDSRVSSSFTPERIDALIEEGDAALTSFISQLLYDRVHSKDGALRHYAALREIVRRYAALRRFNLNVRLQLRALKAFLDMNT